MVRTMALVSWKPPSWLTFLPLNPFRVDGLVTQFSVQSVSFFLGGAHRTERAILHLTR